MIKKVNQTCTIEALNCWVSQCAVKYIDLCNIIYNETTLTKCPEAQYLPCSYYAGVTRFIQMNLRN